jgi:hypothetical protein
MKTSYARRLPHLLLATAITGLAGTAQAQTADGPSFEVYGFAQVDFIQDFKRVNPKWDDTLRPSKIPTTEAPMATTARASISVKQSRFGVKAQQEIAGKPLFVKFEFDLFGVGGDEGQTTFRLRHAYGSWGPILAGQTNSLFMDGDIFPNTIDYWGPTGMVFLRNPQVRYTFASGGGSQFAIAVEKPGNDIDPGNVRTVSPGARLQHPGRREPARPDRPVPLRRRLGPRAAGRHPAPRRLRDGGTPTTSPRTPRWAGA